MQWGTQPQAWAGSWIREGTECWSVRVMGKHGAQDKKVSVTCTRVLGLMWTVVSRSDPYSSEWQADTAWALGRGRDRSLKSMMGSFSV